MPTWMLVAGGIMLVVLAFLASQMMGGSPGRADAGAMSASRSAGARAVMERRDEIVRLVEQGQKTEAIKLMREVGGMDLAEAKKLVDVIERLGGMPPSSSTPVERPELPPEALAEVRAALAAGNKIEAIKLYREHTGLGLKEAKDAVDAME